MLSERNRGCLVKTRENGTVVCFVTGRKSLRQIGHVADLCDYIVLSNGGTALKMPGEELLYTTLVDPADLEKLVDFCNRERIVLHIMDENYWGVNFFTDQVREQEVRYQNRAVLYRAFQDVPLKAVDGFVANGDWRVLERFIRAEKLNLCCVATAKNMVDIMPAGVNKWQGVQRVAEREEISPHEIIAAGNYYNDLEMIIGAAVGVAVQNLSLIHIWAPQLRGPFYRYRRKSYLEAGKKGRSVPATALIGMVCRMTCPGPLTTVLKMPSPPKSIFFTPGTETISMPQEASIAAR